MKTSRKHLLALTLLTALSPLAPTAAFAQLHLEMQKHLIRRLKSLLFRLTMTMDFIQLLKRT